MRKSKISILFLKIAVLTSPVLILLLSYYYFDPFRVIKKYSNYKKDCFVALNNDFIGTEVYLNNKENYHYNAFIFGNSRSLAYKCEDWKNYIPNAMPMHYDASSETLRAMTEKIQFIDSNNGKIDYALLILDKHLLQLLDYLGGPLYKPHPTVSKSSWFSFHTYYFQAYLSEFYFIKYLDFYMTRNYKPYMKGIVETRPIDYNEISNENYLKIYDEELEKNPKAYIQKHIEYYPTRDTINTKTCNPVISKQQLIYLSEIKRIFTKQNTKYKIVISPPYDQEYFNPKDLLKLKSIFGDDNVYDFSGKNEYTRHIENYYESFHYRPKVARDIMKKIYADEK